MRYSAAEIESDVVPSSVQHLDSSPMTELDEHGRPEPPPAADETATLVGFLEYQRATLAWKCAGLDSAGLGATVAASSMTLGGMLEHLAYVEADWEWHSAAEDTPEQLLVGSYSRKPST